MLLAIVAKLRRFLYWKTAKGTSSPIERGVTFETCNPVSIKDEARIDAEILSALTGPDCKPSKIIGNLRWQGSRIDPANVRDELARMLAQGKIACIDGYYCRPEDAQAYIDMHRDCLIHSSRKFSTIPDGATRFDQSWERLERDEAQIARNQKDNADRLNR